MEGKLAVKRPHEDKSTLKYGEWFQNNIYRQAPPFSSAVSRKKVYSTEVKDCETSYGKEGTAFTGSLAEVYEKALNNVLNIKPNFKMDENRNERSMFAEKTPLSASDTTHLQPSGTCKSLHLPHNELCQQQQQHRIGSDKKLNSTCKSAFHVPEKRRALNGQSQYRNWSHDAQFSYPVNYPSDYYPVIRPPPFYPRYDNLYLERFNCYPGPRRREFPVFTHVLPWLQFERDYKPMTSPRYGEWCQKGTMGHDARNEIKDKNDYRQYRVGLRPLTRDEKSADQKDKSADTENHEEQSTHIDEKCNKSPTQTDLCNVRTRRMRAIEKRNDLYTSSKNDSFGSPKEEFLFRLGLTRVEKCHDG